jgi:hypothetical protein
MKRYSGIDYKQRPSSYWNDQDVLETLLRNVKGRERRAMIRTCWEQGRLGELGETFLKETLSEEERTRLGRIHPVFMGGEYLPDYQAEEVEIARLDLNSTTADVISMRTRRQPGGIGYRVVDEYGTEFRLERDHSRKPLTLGQLIRFIDGTSHPDLVDGLALGYNEMNASCAGDRESYRYFTTVSSDIYPQLVEHYDHVFEEWANEGN